MEGRTDKLMGGQGPIQSGMSMTKQPSLNLIGDLVSPKANSTKRSKRQPSAPSQDDEMSTEELTLKSILNNERIL